MENLLLILMIISIVFNAIGNGMRQRNANGIIYHIFWGLEILIFLSFIFIPLQPTILNILIVITSYSLLRFGLFNSIRNIAAKQHIMYIGGTAWQDIKLTTIFNTPTLRGVLFTVRWLLFIIGIVLMQNIL